MSILMDTSSRNNGISWIYIYIWPINGSINIWYNGYIYICKYQWPIQVLKIEVRVYVAFFRPYEWWGYSLKNRPET